MQQIMEQKLVKLSNGIPSGMVFFSKDKVFPRQFRISLRFIQACDYCLVVFSQELKMSTQFLENPACDEQLEMNIQQI